LRERLTVAQQKATSDRTAPPAVADLGRLYQANHFPKEAEACWRWLTAEEPDTARWHYCLSSLLQSDGRFEEAANELERVVQQEPRYSPAWLELGQLKIRSSDVGGARKAFEERLTLLSNDPYAMLGLARIELLEGDRAAARRRLEAILHDHPGFSSAHNLYAEILSAAGENEAADRERWQGRIAGRFREAEDPWLDELRESCFDPSQLAVWGSIDFQAKFGDRGKHLFERAIEVAPENPIGYESMGQWYLENNDLVAALKTFTKAIQLTRPSLGLFVNLAETFRRMKQPAETLRAVQRGLAIIPEASELYYELGVAYDDLNQPDDAVAAYERAIARSPNAAAAHVNLAVILLKRKRDDEAIDHLKQALTAQPTMPKALAMMGDIELARGRLEEASRYIKPLFQFYPGTARARRSMVQWHVARGSLATTRSQFDEAEKAFLTALEIDPNSLEANGNLGVLYGQRGRFQEALKSFEVVHRLQPDDPRPLMFMGFAYAQLGQKDDARRVLGEGEQLAVKAGNNGMLVRIRELLSQLPP
jgi:HemY protein